MSKLNKYKNLINFKLITNFLFLAITQGVNLVLPIVVMPYLLRVIGVEKFGVVILAQTVMTYLYVITEYGFNITATKQASINRDNKLTLTNLFNHVTTTKILLLIMSFIFLYILTLSPFMNFYQFKKLYFFSFGMVVGKALFPMWFFQGIERMKYIAFCNAIAKVILVTLIFKFIISPKDYIYINLLWSIGDMAIGVISLFLVKYKFGININVASIDHIKAQLKDGAPMFITNLSNNIYMNSSIIILSLFANSYTVGLYAIAERLMLLAKQIAGIILQATYPYACQLAVNSWDKLQRFFKQELIFFSFFFSLIGLILAFFSSFFTALFAGKEVAEAANYLKLISFVPLIVSLNMPAYQMMVIHDLKKGYVSIMLLGAIFSVLLNFIFSSTLGATGTSYAVLITEVIITLSFHIVLFTRYTSFRIKYL